MAIQPTFSLIVPAKNEDGSLPHLCHEVDRALRKTPYELVIVDDHSTDRTAEVIKELQKIYPIQALSLSNSTGKSAGILAGIEASRSDVVGYIDADLQYTPRAIPQMVELVASGQANLVNADRIKKPGSYMPSRFARIRNKLYRWLFKLDCDVQSGLKVFEKSYICDLPIHINNSWSLDAQLLNHVVRRGGRIKSVAITYDNRHSGEAKNTRRKLNACKQIFEIIYLWLATRSDD